MNTFRSQRPEPRNHCVTMRLSEEQNALLDKLCEQTKESKGELLRIALDFWIQNSPEGKRALRQK